MVELLYGYRRNFNCFFAADSWGARAAKRFAFRCLAAYSAAGRIRACARVGERKKCGRAAFRKVGEDTEIEKAAVWGYASRLVFIAFITVSIVSSASAKAIIASQN